MQGRPHIHPLALPALRTFFLFALGIFCSHQGWIGGLEAAIAGTLASIICLFSALQPSRRLVTLKPLVRTVALAIGVIALGSARDALFHAHPPHHVFHQIDDRHDDGLCMVGRVTAPPKSSQWSTRITLSTDSLVSGPVTRKTCGTILVHADASEWTPDVGDVLRICGQLEHLPQRNNPAEFDYGRYLTRQGISAILQAENLDERTLVHSNPSPLRRLGSALSRYTIQVVSEHVETREGRALAFSLLLGDRTQLDEETLNWFRTTGLSHLLAISGLHVLLIGMVVYALSGPVLFRLGLPFRIAEIIRTVITLSTLGTYLLICGGAASAVRAVVMAATVLIGRIFQFQGHPVNSLGFAGIVLLMVRPDQLEEAGFQLSFAAVGGLLVLLPALSRCVPVSWYRMKGARIVLSSILVSLTAILSTAPVLSAHFGRVAFAGVLLNLPAIPLTVLVLTSSLLLPISAAFTPVVAPFFGEALSVLASLLVQIAHLGTATMGWMATVTVVDRPAVIAAYVCLLIVPAVRRGRRLRTVIAAALLLTVNVWVDVFTGSVRPAVDILMLSVGHGDAGLLSLPGNRHVLIDAGRANGYVDYGQRAVLEHCHRFGIEQLEAVVVTHADGDHVGGVFSVLRGIDVKQVILPKRAREPPAFTRLQLLSDSLGISVVRCGSGDTLHWGPLTYTEVLSPDALLSAATDENEASLVIRLTFGETHMLFMGDAEGHAERRLCAKYGDRLKSDVVKVGHHGSRTSSSHCLVQFARPAWAVVSVGNGRMYGLPNEEVIRRWTGSGAEIYITGKDGAVWLRSNGRRVTRLNWRR